MKPRIANALGILAVLLVGTLTTPVVAQDLALGSFVFPVLSPVKTSGYGSRVHPVLKYHKHHDGIDLAAPSGSVIRALRAGRVVYADPHGAYGNLVVIEHERGLTTHYGHCQSIRVEPGQKIAAGQIIGTVGNTGRVTGAHLHFEVRRNGKAQDPEKYFPGLTAKAQG